MPKLKVLIVDDEGFFRNVLDEWLNSWGYDTVQAPGGKEAIDAIKKDKFDIVILDYMMPAMDGLATLKKIRGIDKDIAVIMLTGHPTTTSMADTDKLKISAYVTKLGSASDVKNDLKPVLSMIDKTINK